MSDSTNVERPGYTPSEKIVGKSLEKFIMESDQRIIIATFASNVSRLQQILDIAAKAGRKVAVCGRSMEKISKVSMELGYLKDSGKVMIDISETALRAQPADHRIHRLRVRPCPRCTVWRTAATSRWRSTPATVS